MPPSFSRHSLSSSSKQSIDHLDDIPAGSWAASTMIGWRSRRHAIDPAPRAGTGAQPAAFGNPTRCGWAQWSCWLNLYHPLRAFEEIIWSMKREASRPDPQVIATRSAKSAQSETNQSFRRSYFEGLKFGKHGVLHVGRPAPFPA
jgi:hypothetical protein